MQDLFGRLIRGVIYTASAAVLILAATAIILFLVVSIGKILAW